jgi:hypothetical protein
MEIFQGWICQICGFLWHPQKDIRMVIGSFERGAMGIAIFSVSAVCR